jgi:hypothetical protein
MQILAFRKRSDSTEGGHRGDRPTRRANEGLEGRSLGGESMIASNSLGAEALERIARQWQVDADATQATETGFDWWPGDHRVSVMAQPAEVKEQSGAWRLVVRTEYLSGVPVDDPKMRELLLAMGSFAPTYAWVFTPPEVTREYELQGEGSLHLQSTVYLRPDTASWLPEFFARMAIMQPIDAQRQAEAHAEVLKATRHTSRPPALLRPPGTIDDILGVAQDVYVPAGREVSRWSGSAEFGATAKQFGRQDMCFGNGDDTGLTLETPVGESSALVTCRAESAHPALGNGLLSTVILPFQRTHAEIADEAMWLNFFESTMWTNVPQLGSWHSRERGSGLFHSASGFFVPNALYAPGLATNCALWRLGLARWVKSTLWKDLEDKPMVEVLNKRLGL